jgi:hypothetical protein
MTKSKLQTNSNNQINKKTDGLDSRLRGNDRVGGTHLCDTEKRRLGKEILRCAQDDRIGGECRAAGKEPYQRQVGDLEIRILADGRVVFIAPDEKLIEIAKDLEKQVLQQEVKNGPE